MPLMDVNRTADLREPAACSRAGGEEGGQARKVLALDERQARAAPCGHMRHLAVQSQTLQRRHRVTPYTPLPLTAHPVHLQ